jgi:pimeloyl-ACP methyl ester carboxylesterase
MKKSSRIAYEFALEKNKGNLKIYEKLKSIDCSYVGESWLNDLLFVTGQVVKHKGSLYGRKNYNRFIVDFLLSADYGLKDLLNRQRGSLQSIKFLWQELMTIDFEDITKFAVPVVFMQGRGDYHVSSELVYEWYEALRSPKQFHWFERSCHFPQWEESQKFYELMKSVAENGIE